MSHVVLVGRELLHQSYGTAPWSTTRLEMCHVVVFLRGKLIVASVVRVV